jgi:hypothetical protein
MAKAAKTKSTSSPRPAKAPPKKSSPKPGSKGPPRPAERPGSKTTSPKVAPTAPAPTLPSGDARRHVLSLSFLRDGDEFLARLETDAGQITEMKNRSLDHLLSLVAGELEDLLE